MGSDNFQDEIKYLENELLALKMSQGAIKNVKTYFWEILDVTTKMKITYAPGDNAIVSRLWVGGDHFIGNTLTTPSGNTQYILVNSDGIERILLQSTRPIISVENIT